MDIFLKLLKDYSSVEEISKDHSLQMWLTIGRTMVCLVFTPIGILCLTQRDRYAEGMAKAQRKILKTLFGLFLIFCGLSRGIAAISNYHYFAWMDALLTVSAGITGTIALFYIPFVIKSINQEITLTKINEDIIQTSIKLEEVKKLSKRHSKKDK